MRSTTAVRLLGVLALTVLSTLLAPASSTAASCDPAICNQKCVNAGFFGGACINGRCFCISVIP